MSLHDKQLVSFHVVCWDTRTQAGIIADDQRMTYRVTLENLSLDCQGQLHVGETVEGIVSDWQTIVDIAPTSSALRERPADVESVGASGGAHGWTPQTGSSKYSGAKPDSGRFSHPKN